MFNFELLLFHGFSTKNCEILHKAVLTPQEYEDEDEGGRGVQKKMGKK